MKSAASPQDAPCVGTVECKALIHQPGCERGERHSSAASKFGEPTAGPDEASSIRQPGSPIQPSAASVHP